MDFKVLNGKIASKFKKMQTSGQLFRVNLTGAELWDLYLKSFVNPKIWRVVSEHDCNKDSQFIHRYGNVVSIDNAGNIVTMFDLDGDLGEYQPSINALRDVIKSASVESVFKMSKALLIEYKNLIRKGDSYRLGYGSNFKEYSNKKNKDGIVSDSDDPKGKEVGVVYTFDHFNVLLHESFMIDSRETLPSVLGETLPSVLGELNTSRQLFEKGLMIPQETLETVIQLFKQGSLLKKDLFMGKVQEFLKLKKQFDKVEPSKQGNWMWSKFQSISFNRFANELVGTLCMDLAEGKDINYVCLEFNKRADSTNYMNATAPRTPRQLAEAEKAVNDGGYTDSFNRRYATMRDISIDEIKHNNADNEVAEAPTGVFSAAGMNTNPSIKRHKHSEFKNVESVSIETFMNDILPTATGVEVLFETKYKNNLMTLFTAVNQDAKKMFSWDNHFSWTYNGNVSAKSMIKQAVKSRGGNVDGDLSIRASFPEVTDDYDLRVIEPNGDIIYYSNLRKKQPSSGMLDLDANGLDGAQTPENRVENVIYSDKSLMPIGNYRVELNNYSKRGLHTKFQIEIEYDGNVTTLELDKTLNSTNKITTCVINFDGSSFSIEPDYRMKVVSEDTTSQEFWGINTNQFHKVNLICNSPNYWGDNNHGQKELFFLLQGCKTDTALTPFDPTQLHSDLMPIRKDISMLKDRMMLEPADRQLSGIGFNMSNREELIVKVHGSFKRVLKVCF